MAINIDTVYQKVLAIANKEQRGYINPQQFNLFANQAQLDIFEDYFFKLNQLEFGQKNSTQYADLKTILLEKIQPFEKTGALSYDNTGNERLPSYTSPTDLYRIGSVRYLDLGSNLCSDPTFSDASGSEMITNGTFTDTINPWILDATQVSYSGDKLSIASTGYGLNIQQSATSFASGTAFYPEKTYRVTFTVSNHVSGGMEILLLTGPNTGGAIPHTDPRYFARYTFNAEELGNGTYSVLIKPEMVIAGGSWAVGVEGGIYFKRGINTWFYGASLEWGLDNVSVKEVGNEWTVTPANSWNFGNGIEFNGSNNPVVTIPGVSGSWMNGGQAHVWTFNGDNIQKAWAGNSVTSTVSAPIANETHGFLENTTTLVQGSTYELRYEIGAATKGKLYLANHISTDIPENIIHNGTTNNLPMWDIHHLNGYHTKYFVQGATNTDKISIYRDKEFDGYIANLSVKLIASDTNGVEVQPVRGNELTTILNSKLVQPTIKRPVYVKNENGINVYPKTITDGVTCYYIKKPSAVSWNYTEINSVALYNSSSSTDFQLHDSEENTLVMKILTLSGINMQNQELTQIAMSKEASAK